jgi:hypothetical protein
MEDASDDAGGPEKRARELAGLERRIAMHPGTAGDSVSFPATEPFPSTRSHRSRDGCEHGRARLDDQRKISIDEYLEEVALFCNSEYGSNVRSRFQDVRGRAELAMLAALTSRELEELWRAVAIPTPAKERRRPAR